MADVESAALRAPFTSTEKEPGQELAPRAEAQGGESEASSGAAPAPSGSEDIEQSLRLDVIAKELFHLAFPQMIGYGMTLTNELVNTVFMGQNFGEKELAAVGLGNMMQNCIGLSIGLGLIACMDTLVSQAFGAGNHAKCVQYLQRCRVLCMLLLLFMVPMLFFTERILVTIRQDPEVAKYAGQYNSVSALGIIFIFQGECGRKFLSNRGYTAAPSALSVVIAFIHPLYAWLFIVYLRWGNFGAGCANVASWFLSYITLAIYMAWTAKGMGFTLVQVLGVERGNYSIVHLRELLQVGLPATVQICSEWWFWEVAVFIVGYLGPTALAAQVSAVNLLALVVMPLMGFCESVATMAGNSLGANNPRRAKKIIWFCVILNLLVWSVLSTVILLLRDGISNAYTKEESVRLVMRRLMVVYIICGYADGTQGVLASSLRGMGKMMLPSTTYIITYWFITIPLGCIFIWPLNMGVDGMFRSFGIGMTLNAITFGTAVFRLDFVALAKEAHESMTAEAAEGGPPIDVSLDTLADVCASVADEEQQSPSSFRTEPRNMGKNSPEISARPLRSWG